MEIQEIFRLNFSSINCHQTVHYILLTSAKKLNENDISSTNVMEPETRWNWNVLIVTAIIHVRHQNWIQKMVETFMTLIFKLEKALKVEVRLVVQWICRHY